MRKKKELPRKRKRFIKKVIFLSGILFITIFVAGAISFYFFEAKMQRLYPTTAVASQQTHVQQPDKISITLQQSLAKNQITYTSISKGNDSYIITLQEGGKVTFSSQKDIMTQIASLQYILSHLTMEGRQFNTLDLRFDQPVIVLKP